MPLTSFERFLFILPIVSHSPQMSHGLPGPSPYTIYCIPQFSAKPPRYVGSLRPHPLLESAVVNWDLIEHPSTMTLNKYLRLGLNRLLVEQATTLPLPAISIISIYLPWTINVRARNGAYVTPRRHFWRRLSFAAHQHHRQWIQFASSPGR